MNFWKNLGTQIFLGNRDLRERTTRTHTLDLTQQWAGIVHPKSSLKSSRYYTSRYYGTSPNKNCRTNTAVFGIISVMFKSNETTMFLFITYVKYQLSNCNLNAALQFLSSV